MSTGLKPFFCFYGGKWRAAHHYPAPHYNTIVEPFAGAAGYAVRHHDRNIILYEADPIVAGVWRYLVAAQKDEIMRLPLIFDHVDQLDICQEAKSLIGFWLNKATTHPCKQPSAWMRQRIRPNSFWGEAIRQRIADQVDHIRHWQVHGANCFNANNIDATWFIDPPYNNKAGRLYSHQVSSYPVLAEWCMERRGQVIVCEQEGADWLPFVPLGSFKSTEGKHGKAKTREAIWTRQGF